MKVSIKEKQYEKYVVAFLDILGFKKLIYEKSFSDVFGIQTINKIFAESAAKGYLYREKGENGSASFNGNPEYEKRRLRYNESLESSIIHIMSDSIVVAAKDSCPEALAVVIDICDLIQKQLFYINEPVLLRGAIAVGDLYIKDNIVFGKGLVDAYLVQEKYAVYPRVIIIKDIIKNRMISIDTDYVLPQDEDKYYRIDSIERFLGVDKAGSWGEIEKSIEYKRLKNLTQKQLDENNDDHVRQKYIWIDNVLFQLERKLNWIKKDTGF